MKKITLFFLRNKAFAWTLLFSGGILAYLKMGKLEDAPFTIKQAVVTTAYPGASPSEVQQQVTDPLEEAIQSLGELYYLKSEIRAGLSRITVYVKKEIRADEMQQLWDKLRRKVSDAQRRLPAGAGPSLVNDDFGDVLGVFYGLNGKNHTNRELETEAKRIKNIILQIPDVAKVELFGVRQPIIEVEVSPALMSSTGITLDDIRNAVGKQNEITDAGALESERLRMRISPGGSFTSLEEIRNLTVTRIRH